ncbi:MAG: glycosyltransferase family 39 protein [Ignavibacteria bacterium]|nr:glycosyltransferase family 39 protein [Ignavibacteria bacterium]
MSKEGKVKLYLFLLIIYSIIIRIILASIVELSNDEVNYWLYAVYPDLSHFDHPPMVGYLINIFTLNLSFQSEFFIRLPSIIIGTLNTVLIFYIVRKLKNDIAGFYAAVLYNSSLYCFVIAGIFIMPDTPLLLFWLLAIIFSINSFNNGEISTPSKRNILIVGVFIGFAMLSKYTGLFLWIGIILYIIIYDKKWLKIKETYISLILTLIVFSPVIIWNLKNDFISFTFQSGRVGILQSGLKPEYILTEILGEFFYNNPIIFILSILSLIYFFKSKELKKDKNIILILLTSLPIILTFILFSLTKRTLPHWSAPGYTGLLILISIVTYEKIKFKEKNIYLPKSILSAFILCFVIVLLAAIQVKTGIIYKDEKHKDAINLGKDDVSLDLYGMSQLRDEFIKIAINDVKYKIMNPDYYIISFRWFPAANFDYYISRYIGKKTYAFGSIESIRNYYFINEKKGELPIASDCYFICSSRDYKHPSEIYKDYFSNISLPDTIKIYRNNENVMNYFVFRLRNLKKNLKSLY